MKKIILIISFLVLILAFVVGEFRIYIVNSPEYALKNIIEDVNDFGIEGLNSHVTGKAKEILNKVSSITKSSLFNAIMGVINKSDYIGVLKSEIQEVHWSIDDVKKNKKNAVVILTFNYEDKLIGKIEISMIRENGEWKIDNIEYPQFTEVNW